MKTIRLAIPMSVLAYADFAACEYVPPKRTGGYNESGCTHQKRGDGDHLELLAKLTLKHYIVIGEGKSVRLENERDGGRSRHHPVVRGPQNRVATHLWT
jgi:hypothetical protein